MIAKMSARIEELHRKITNLEKRTLNGELQPDEVQTLLANLHMTWEERQIIYHRREMEIRNLPKRTTSWLGIEDLT